MKYVIGIDEVGRGPLAGPLTLGFVMVPLKEVQKTFKPLLELGLNDSKLVSLKKRLKIVESLDGVRCFTLSIGPRYIDKHGMSKALYILIKRGLKKLDAEADKCFLKLDGALKAPKEFSHEVIIGGDRKEPVIMLASVIAKVKRDKYMESISKKYPEYGFSENKGYGTKKHIEAIKKHKLSKIHRKSFCTRII